MVDVVERLRDPTDPSTERTAPPRSAHIQLDDVPRTSIQPSVEGEFRQHDGVVTMMMFHRHRASPKLRNGIIVTPSMRLYLPRVEARLRGITALKAMSQVR